MTLRLPPRVVGPDALSTPFSNTPLLRFPSVRETTLHGHIQPQVQVTVALLCNRQTDTQTDRHTDRQTDRQTHRQTDGHTDRRTHRQTDSQTDIITDRQTHRQTDTQTDRLTDRHNHRQTDRHTDRQTDIPSNDWQHKSFSQSALIALMNALLLSFPSISISKLFRRVFVQLCLY